MGRPFPSYLRIGDDEREAAVAALNRHFAEGRITMSEHDERTTAAFAARTQGDLDKLFADLPPLGAVPPPPVPDTRRATTASAVGGFARSVVPMACIAIGVLFAFFMLTHGVPILAVALIFMFTRGSRRRHARASRQVQGPPQWQAKSWQDKQWQAKQWQGKSWPGGRNGKCW